MGSWGYGPFQSDSAQDWVYDVAHAYGKSIKSGLKSKRFDEAYAAIALLADARATEVAARKRATSGKRSGRSRAIDQIEYGLGSDIIDNDPKLSDMACSRLNKLQSEIDSKHWPKYKKHFERLRKKLSCDVSKKRRASKPKWEKAYWED